MDTLRLLYYFVVKVITILACILRLFYFHRPLAWIMKQVTAFILKLIINISLRILNVAGVKVTTSVQMDTLQDRTTDRKRKQIHRQGAIKDITFWLSVSNEPPKIEYGTNRKPNSTCNPKTTDDLPSVLDTRLSIKKIDKYGSECLKEDSMKLFFEELRQKKPSSDWLKLNDIKLSVEDALSLQSDNYLTDAVVDAMLSIICLDSMKIHEMVTAIAIRVTALSLYLNLDEERIPLLMLKHIQNNEHANLIFFPIHLEEQSHYGMAVANRMEKSIVYFDPFQPTGLIQAYDPLNEKNATTMGERMMKRLGRIKALMEKATDNYLWCLNEDALDSDESETWPRNAVFQRESRIPVQNDIFNCGIFILCFAELMTKRPGYDSEQHLRNLSNLNDGKIRIRYFREIYSHPESN